MKRINPSEGKTTCSDIRRFFYRPQRSWGKVMFLQACVILFGGGGCLPQCMLGYHAHTPEQTPPRSRQPPEETPPWEQTPLWSRHPPKSRHPPEQTPPRADTPPKEQTPPRRRACWEIQSTCGRYASYWNAILFIRVFLSWAILPILCALLSSNFCSNRKMLKFDKEITKAKML